MTLCTLASAMQRVERYEYVSLLTDRTPSRIYIRVRISHTRQRYSKYLLPPQTVPAFSWQCNCNLIGIISLPRVLLRIASYYRALVLHFVKLLTSHSCALSTQENVTMHYIVLDILLGIYLRDYTSWFVFSFSDFSLVLKRRLTTLITDSLYTFLYYLFDTLKHQLEVNFCCMSLVEDITDNFSCCTL